MDYYKALEKSNWLVKLDARKVRHNDPRERYAGWYNYKGPLTENFITNNADGPLAQKIYDLETYYLNSENTRKTSVEPQNYKVGKSFVKLNAASLPSSTDT